MRLSKLAARAGQKNYPTHTVFSGICDRAGSVTFHDATESSTAAIVSDACEAATCFFLRDRWRDEVECLNIVRLYHFTLNVESGFDMLIWGMP
jgi:hypothetical protein